MLRLVRLLCGACLVLGLAFATVPEASPMDAANAGLARRGVGAWLRAKVERTTGLVATDPLEARAEAEALLAELRIRRETRDDVLDADTVDTVAETLIAARNQAVAALSSVELDRGEAFIRSVADGAVWSDWRWGVPSSITLAQAILESNWGKSAPGHNLFGLKGEGPAGSITRRVVEYRHGRRGHKLAPFRAYETPNQAVRDHGRILGENGRYAPARRVSEDPASFARALTGTYATDPAYARKLLGVIEARGLDRYDWAGPAPWSGE